MEISIVNNVAEVSKKVSLVEVQDYTDVLGNAFFSGANSIIIYKQSISSEFFDLKTGIAGETLQKFSNYNMRLAVIGSFSNIESKSLNDFIRESNRTGRIIFAEAPEQAYRKWGIEK